MALYKLDIEKQLGSEYWSNRYFISAGTLAAANAQAPMILACEASFHRTAILFTKYRVSDTVPGTDNFIVTPANVNGILPKNGAFLPLFNVVRSDFRVEGTGRPSRKYYRIGLCAGDAVADFQHDPTIRTLVQTNLNTLITALNDNDTPIVDADLQAWVSSTTFIDISMRQLRRGTKQRTQPIL